MSSQFIPVPGISASHGYHQKVIIAEDNEIVPIEGKPHFAVGRAAEEEYRPDLQGIKIQKSAANARNFSQCDSLLIGGQCGAHTFPYLEVKNTTASVEHEASTSKIGEDQIFYCDQRGISTQDAVNMIVNGFCKEVFRELPMEFAVEAQKLLGVSLEGSVG